MQIPHPDRGVILIAERDQNVRELQTYFLNQAGFTLEFADDGQFALERAQALQPLLVVSEILIPTLDGLALCRRLGQDSLTRHIPVLIFSFLAASARASEAGAKAFLRKPFVESTFVAVVQDLIAAQPERMKQWASQ